MATDTIPVDLYNPGQILACLGLMELAEVLCGDAAGAFDWTDPTLACFRLIARGDASPLARAQDFLAQATVISTAPQGTDLSTDKWKVDTEPAGATFPMPAPSSPATLPALLRSEGVEIQLDSWGDTTRRDAMKFWAGMQGKPAARLVDDALALCREDLPLPTNRLFDTGRPQTGSFGFEWRRTYVPLQIGFSLNRHKSGATKMITQGYPLVEILAAIGVQHARAHRPEPRNKLIYRYAIVGGDPVPLLFHRAALGCADLPFPTRVFTMHLDWPGQEGQARCITHVTEESTP